MKKFPCLMVCGERSGSTRLVAGGTVWVSYLKEISAKREHIHGKEPLDRASTLNNNSLDALAVLSLFHSCSKYSSADESILNFGEVSVSHGLWQTG